jgi:hypothetical protein
MHFHNYFFRHHRFAEEAMANLKVPEVVCAAVIKIYHAGLTDTVSALQVILRFPA